MFSATLQIQNSKPQHFRFTKDLKTKKSSFGTCQPRQSKRIICSDFVEHRCLLFLTPRCIDFQTIRNRRSITGASTNGRQTVQSRSGSEAFQP
ncbi:MAG: hypothetical protein VX972_04295, partial [Cyanobacteriota bacterium]|nr:hypothetical protein [Cyanobacteriota bacterium]